MNMKLLALFLTVLISGCRAGDTCWYYDEYYMYLQTYCEGGCCGNSESDVCCDDDLAAIGVIVGGTVGGIIVLAVIISITCCCIYMVKRNQRPNMVIHPTPDSQITAISAGQRQHVPIPYGLPSSSYQPHSGIPPPPTYNSLPLTVQLPEGNSSSK